ncbi:hypothetical protein AB0K08_06150 [Citricoccus sp. NPDC055426]|uniref:hypothetical protein n=1 Tax=Citricoccus sp. NPDC055426 TaxID=3155536 RepID=UPI003446DC79
MAGQDRYDRNDGDRILAAGYHPVRPYAPQPGYLYRGHPGQPGPRAIEPQKSFMAMWLISV